MIYSYNTFDGWLQARGFGSSLDADGQLKDGTSQSFFSSQYSAWLNDLIAFYADAIRSKYGLPPDTRLLVSFDASKPSGLPVISGLTQGQVDELFDGTNDFSWASSNSARPIVHERYYSNSFNFALFDNVSPVAGAVFANGAEDAQSIAVVLSGSDPDQGDAVVSFTLKSLPLPSQGVLYTYSSLKTAVSTGVA
jgi:hypothetical protein